MADPEHQLSVLNDWLMSVQPAIAKQVLVKGGSSTFVRIDHRLVCPLAEHEGWRVSTKASFLPQDHFSSQARFYLKTASKDRGRTIYCHDLSLNEVVAAASYHIDKDARLPVVITTIGLRTDAARTAFLTYRTLAAGIVLKRRIHAVAEKTGRGGYVDIDLAEASLEPLLRKLGFQKAPKLKGVRPGGIHLRQPAPPSAS